MVPAQKKPVHLTKSDLESDEESDCEIHNDNEYFRLRPGVFNEQDKAKLAATSSGHRAIRDRFKSTNNIQLQFFEKSKHLIAPKTSEIP